MDVPNSMQSYPFNGQQKQYLKSLLRSCVLKENHRDHLRQTQQDCIQRLVEYCGLGAKEENSHYQEDVAKIRCWFDDVQRVQLKLKTVQEAESNLRNNLRVTSAAMATSDVSLLRTKIKEMEKITDEWQRAQRLSERWEKFRNAEESRILIIGNWQLDGVDSHQTRVVIDHVLSMCDQIDEYETNLAAADKDLRDTDLLVDVALSTMSSNTCLQPELLLVPDRNAALVPLRDWAQSTRLPRVGNTSSPVAAETAVAVEVGIMEIEIPTTECQTTTNCLNKSCGLESKLNFPDSKTDVQPRRQDNNTVPLEYPQRTCMLLCSKRTNNRPGRTDRLKNSLNPLKRLYL